MTKDSAEMQIVNARVKTLTAPVTDGTKMSFSSLSRRATVLVELETRSGLIGLGESWVNFPEWAPTERVATLTQGILPLVIGEDASEISILHDRMTRSLIPIGRQWGAPGPIMQGISAVDIALWDLLGKAQGKSVAELLGGRKRENVNVYASSLGPTGVSEQANLCKLGGFSAVKVKLGFGKDTDAENLATASQICGDDTVLYADANQGWTLEQAIDMAPLLQKYNIAWIEEPISGNDLAELEIFHSKTGLRVATGENLLRSSDFIPYICSKAIAIIQPDLTKSGGFSEVLSICRIAESEGKEVIPHFYGGAIGFGATLQLASSMLNISTIEYDIRDNPLRDSLIKNPPTPVNGKISIPDAPGLGIELDEKAISKYAKEQP